MSFDEKKVLKQEDVRQIFFYNVKNHVLKNALLHTERNQSCIDEYFIVDVSLCNKLKAI